MIIQICDECEACWNKNQTVGIKNFKGLSTFLKEHGLQYDTAEVENLEYVTMELS